MKRLNSTTGQYILLIAILIFNILSFVIGVLPPAGRAYYLSEIVLEITTLELQYFILVMPWVCVASILFAVFQTVRVRLKHKGYLILGMMFAVELLLWYPIFQMLMSI